MERWLIAGFLCLAASLATAADAGKGVYAGALLEDFARGEPKLLAAAIIATPPKAAGPVVAAATDRTLVGTPAEATDIAAIKARSTTSTPSADGSRVDIRLPLQDVSGDPAGVLHLTYTYRAGEDRAALERAASALRDRLHRRISHAGNLFDPYPYEPDAPSHTYAQKLVDEFLDRYRDIEIMAIHATAPESDYNVIVGSNIGRLGKKADNDDMRCVFTGKPNLEVNSTGKRFESEMQLHDRAGNVIGAVGVVYAYTKDSDKEALHTRAEALRKELEKKIPDAAALFGPAT
jgi:hypothetical protein